MQCLGSHWQSGAGGCCCVVVQRGAVASRTTRNENRIGYVISFLGLT